MSKHYQPPRWDRWSLHRFGQLMIVVADDHKLVAMAIVAHEGTKRYDGRPEVWLVGDGEWEKGCKILSRVA